MLKLVEIAGTDLLLDEEVAKLKYDEQLARCNDCHTVKLSDISPSLLNKSLRYPETVYDRHIGFKLSCHADEWPEGFNLDIITIPVGLLGIEYIKTHIFYAGSVPNQVRGSAACVVQVHAGVLTVIMQRNRPKSDMFDLDTYVDEVNSVNVKSGEKLAIPIGYMYTFVNTGSVPVVFARLITNEHQINYDMIRRENGLAYYLIAKNARLEMVPNPRYRNMVPVRRMKVNELNGQMPYTPIADKCLYEELVFNPEMFDFVY